MRPEQSILSRIVSALGADGQHTFSRLCALSARDLQSLLMAVFDKRSTQRTVHDLRRDFARVPLLHPGPVDPRRSHVLLGSLFAAASEFEAIELSPVLPFAATHVLGRAHQNNVLSASRHSELVADPTTALALVAAQRREDPTQRTQPLHLCALHRCVRMQPAPKGLLPHFRLFALVSAEQRSSEYWGLQRHLQVYLQALRLLEALGFRFAALRVDISDTHVIEECLTKAGLDREQVRREVRTQVFADPDALWQRVGLSPLRGTWAQIQRDVLTLSARSQHRLHALESQVLAPLSREFPSVDVHFDLGRSEGLGYYTGPCVRITAEDANHLRLPLVDGGYTHWTAALLSDENERMLSTGIGLDLVALHFDGSGPASTQTAAQVTP